MVPNYSTANGDIVMDLDTLYAILFNPFGIVILFWIGMALYSYIDGKRG